MKRIGYITAFIFYVSFLLTSCSLSPGPKEILSNYLDNYYRGNYDKAYELLSANDKAVKSPHDFSGEPSVYRTLTKAITFNIKEVKVTGDKALATVDVTSPDLSGAMGELFGAAMLSAFSAGKGDDKAMEKIVTEKLKDKNLPTTTRTEQYDLVKDKEGWRVYMGWENEKKITELKADAEKLEKQKKFVDAKIKYIEIQVLSSRDESAPRKIRELDEKIAKYKEKQAYFPNIEVRNIGIGKNYMGETGVFGEIKNKGTKSLKEVEITTYCLDKEGKVVFEKPYHPVRVSRYSLDDEILKPNYSRRFGCKLDDAPSDWRGEVKVEVTDLEFE